jgi:hypothetical protein
VKAAIRFVAFSSEVSSKQHEMAAGFGAALTEIFRGLEQISRPLCHEAGHGAIGNTQFMQTASADDCRSRRRATQPRAVQRLEGALCESEARKAVACRVKES